MKNYLSDKNLIRLLLLLTVILAIAAGYFQVKYEGEQLKYLRLEDKFVRVRGQLGREETQRLIDDSY
jgi:hypothetical protein